MNGRVFLAEEQHMERKATAEAGEVREEGLLRPKGCVLPSSPELGPAGYQPGCTLSSLEKPFPSLFLHLADNPRSSPPWLLEWERGLCFWLTQLHSCSG